METRFGEGKNGKLTFYLKKIEEITTTGGDTWRPLGKSGQDETFGFPSQEIEGVEKSKGMYRKNWHNCHKGASRRYVPITSPKKEGA